MTTISEMSPEFKPFGLVIRTIRENAHLSRTRLCDWTGISRACLPQIEMGERGMTIRTLRLVLDACGCTWAQFGQMMSELDPIPVTVAHEQHRVAR